MICFAFDERFGVGEFNQALIQISNELNLHISKSNLPHQDSLEQLLVLTHLMMLTGLK